MSPEHNEAAVRQALASLSAGDVDGFTAMLAPNYVRHCEAMPPPAGLSRRRPLVRVPSWRSPVSDRSPLSTRIL